MPRGGLALLLALPSAVWAGEPAEARADDLIIEALTITAAGEVFTATGEVTASWRGALLTAEAITFDRASGAAEVTDGELSELGVRFGTASLALRDEVLSGTLTHARLDRPGAHVAGAVLAWDGGERFSFEDGWFSPCDCEAPVWSLEASRGTVDASGWATVSGAWLRIGERRVLPVPWAAVPVGRVAQPLPPRVGWTDDGLTVGVPVWLPLGASAGLAVGPEWRQERGWRVLTDVGMPSGELSGAIGWDTREAATRGTLSGEVGRAETDGWRAAAAGQWTSDAAYVSDFGDSLLARSAPWMAQRGLVGVGPVRGELFVWQDGEDAGARPSLVLERAVVQLGDRRETERSGVGPLRLGAAGRLDAVTDGAARVARAEPSLTVDHSGDVGPLEVNTGLVGRAIGYGGAVSASAADGAAQVSALLPMWADHGAWMHEMAFGGGGSVAGRAGSVLERLPTDAAWTPWSAGPLIESRWWSDRVAVMSTFGVAATPAGVGWSGRTRGSLGPWTATVQSDASRPRAALEQAPAQLSGGRVGYQDEVWELWLGGWMARGEEPLDLGRAGASVWIPGTAGRWRPELELIATPEALQEGRVGLGWSASCGCLTVTGRAALAEDREWPQLGLELQLLD